MPLLLTLDLLFFVICGIFCVSMKVKLSLVASAALVVASCSSINDTLVKNQNRASVVSKPTPAPASQYLALPGRAAVAVNGADVNAAFDAHAAQYAGQPQTAAAMGAVMGNAAAAAAGALAPLQQTPTPLLPAASASPAGPAAPAAPTYIHQTAVPTQVVPGQAVVGMVPDAGMMAGQGMLPGVPMNYSVRITNSTSGKLFVEAQDAAGNIYPCGFMEGGRSATTPFEQAEPIAGPITIVVRDPDKEGAPEIRRFKVEPPTQYANKIVGVSIIPGGKYYASVDGNVYASGEAVAPTSVPTVLPVATAPMPSTPGGLMNYSVKVTNTTGGRLLVEARDAAGTEFPCGEMAGGESRVTPREQAAPIKGAITVIIRDPDKEGQPEIRRYRVNPPANYAGKTLGISIVPGGQYHASIDGQVYYTYTPPEAPPTTNPQPAPTAPAAPAAPAAPVAPVVPAAPVAPAAPVVSAAPAAPAAPVAPAAPAVPAPVTPVAPAPEAAPAGL